MTALQEFMKKRKLLQDSGMGAGFLDRMNEYVELMISRIIQEKEDAFNTKLDDLKSKLLGEIQTLKKDVPRIRAELRKEILAQDLKVKDGRDGKNGEPGLRGFSGERGEPGRPGKNGKDGSPGIGLPGKDGSPDTPDQVVRKVNAADELVLQSQIKELPEALESMRRAIQQKEVVRKFSGRSGGGGTVTYRTPSGDVNGSNTSFTVISVPNFIVSDGITYFENNGYTISGLTVTMTVAPSQYIRYAS